VDEPSSARREADAQSVGPSSRTSPPVIGTGSPSPRHRVRLPRFVAAEPVGLGDVVKRVTASVGVKPCSSCEERAARLNQWVSFEGSSRRGGPPSRGAPR
jgi:hypothetical protein